MLLQIKEGHAKLKTLCGLTHEETQLDYQRKGLGPGDAMLLAPELQVMASLTSINLGLNRLYSEGAKALAPAIRDSPSLTSINLQYTCMGGEGEALLREAVEGRPGFELLL
jgi:NLR family CARD domain-containing protein 3